MFKSVLIIVFADIEHHSISLVSASEHRFFCSLTLYISSVSSFAFYLEVENDSLIYKDLLLNTAAWSLWAEWLYCKPILLGSRQEWAPLSQSVLTEMPWEQKISRTQVVNQRLIRERIFSQTLIRIPPWFCWPNSQKSYSVQTKPFVKILIYNS